MFIDISYSIKENLTFTNINETKFKSNKIYIGKGTKIYQNDSLIKTSSSTNADSITYIGVKEYEADKIIGDNKNMEQNSNYTNNVYTATRDCYVEICLAKKWWQSFETNEILNLKNIITIDYCYPSSNPSVDYSSYVIYVSYNGGMELIERPSLSGAILFKIPTGFMFIKDKEVIMELTWEQLKAQLSTYVETYNDDDYIKIPSQTGLYINLNTLQLQMAEYTSGNISGHAIPLLINGYENAFQGKLLEHFIKKEVTI